jgi:uncharacterized protein YutE (UPF0331/DUF86 family)
MEHQARIIAICSDIDRFFRDYEKIISEGEIDDDITRFHAISMVLFTILNLSFELGEEVIGHRHAGLPGSYRDIFRILREEQLIDEKIRETMSRMVYYRNRLAHQYAGLNREDIDAVITSLDTIRDYISRMKNSFMQSGF